MPSSSTTVNRTIPVGFGKIIRDEAGNILHVEVNDKEEESAAANANPTEMKDIQVDNGITTRWVTDLGGYPKDIAVSEKGGQLLESESIYNFQHCFLFAHGHYGLCVFLYLFHQLFKRDVVGEHIHLCHASATTPVSSLIIPLPREPGRVGILPVIMEFPCIRVYKFNITFDIIFPFEALAMSKSADNLHVSKP